MAQLDIGVLNVHHPNLSLKAQPHAAIMHTCDGAFQSSCDAGISHAILWDVIYNMFNILLPIMEFLRISKGLQHYDGNSISFHVMCE